MLKAFFFALNAHKKARTCRAFELKVFRSK
jgi:hypothetical protein